MKRVCPHCGTRYQANASCPHHPPRPAWRHSQGRSAHDRGYDKQHHRNRAIILRDHPVCQACGKQPSTIADHKVNRARGGTNDLSNYQALCHTCHTRKTAHEAHV